VNRTVEQITLNDLPPSAPRSEVNEEHWSLVEAYAALMRAGEPCPPITLERYGTKYLVHDGTHRVTAARLVGRLTISAFVL